MDIALKKHNYLTTIHVYDLMLQPMDAMRHFFFLSVCDYSHPQCMSTLLELGSSSRGTSCWRHSCSQPPLKPSVQSMPLEQSQQPEPSFIGLSPSGHCEKKNSEKEGEEMRRRREEEGEEQIRNREEQIEALGSVCAF